ncbi:MAG: PqqD family protein [Ruminococcus sp.]|nr:PqqD family protein [Ruminococcus sp.]
MKIKDGYKLKHIAGEDIIIPLADKTKLVNGIFRLNEQGVELFNIFSESGATKDDAAKYLIDTYGISYEQATEDVEEFVQMLKKFNMIED